MSEVDWYKRYKEMEADRDAWRDRFERSDADLAEVNGKVNTLFDAIAHGDEKHRAWLKQAIKDHFERQP